MKFAPCFLRKCRRPTHVSYSLICSDERLGWPFTACIHERVKMHMLHILMSQNAILQLTFGLELYETVYLVRAFSYKVLMVVFSCTLWNEFLLDNLNDVLMPILWTFYFSTTDLLVISENVSEHMYLLLFQGEELVAMDQSQWPSWSLDLSTIDFWKDLFIKIMCRKTQ